MSQSATTTGSAVPTVVPSSKTSDEVVEAPTKAFVSNVHFKNGVYIIFSKWDVKKIVQFCRVYGEVFWSRLVYDKNGNETDRTLVILSDEAYAGLVKAGYGSEDQKRGSNSNRAAGFRIDRYVLHEKQEHPDAPTLFVPAPREHRDSSVVMEGIVDEKIRTLAECDLLPMDSWTVDAPPRSRESGGVKSGAYITFDTGVEHGRVAMVRLLITDTYWPSVESKETPAIFRCFWARERVPRAKRDSSVRSTWAERTSNKKLSPEEREKLHEERRLARVTKLLESAVPATSPRLTRSVASDTSNASTTASE
jgi:hypothetical protein